MSPQANPPPILGAESAPYFWGRGSAPDVVDSGSEDAPSFRPEAPRPDAQKRMSPQANPPPILGAESAPYFWGRGSPPDVVFSLLSNSKAWSCLPTPAARLGAFSDPGVRVRSNRGACGIRSPPGVDSVPRNGCASAPDGGANFGYNGHCFGHQLVALAVWLRFEAFSHLWGNDFWR